MSELASWSSLGLFRGGRSEPSPVGTSPTAESRDGTADNTPGSGSPIVVSTLRRPGRSFG